MTKEEFKLIVKGLKAVYTDPKFIADQYAFDMWFEFFKDYPYKVITMASQSHIATNKYPPTIADIRESAARITTPIDEDMSELEAWSLVRKAISNGNYGAEQEFEKLPPIIQKTLGSPAAIREMAMVDANEVDTIDKSHFVRNYKAQLERSRRDRQLGNSLRLSIEQTRRGDIGCAPTQGLIDTGAIDYEE